MAKRFPPLPLPRSWLTSQAQDEEKTDREYVLAGKSLNPGSKAYLRSLLLNAGWEPEVIEPVIAGKYVARDRVLDLVQQGRRAPDLNEAALRLKKLGFKPNLVELTQGSTIHATEMWDSLTRFPWWVSALRGNRSLVISASTLASAQRATACFVRDLWANLGEAPAYRLPSIRRINLLGFTSSDGVQSFKQNLAPTTGLIVVHGLETPDLVYQMFGYAAAISQVAPHASLVYEAVPSPDVTQDTLLAAARRAGFSTIFGVRRG